MTLAPGLARTGSLLALVAGLTMGGGQVEAGGPVSFTPDFGSSFAIEAQHLAHFGLRLKGIDSGELDLRAKTDLRTAMWPKLWKYACSLPHRNEKVFHYLRHPSGVIELDLMDEHGRSITAFTVHWSTCPK